MTTTESEVAGEAGRSEPTGSAVDWAAVALAVPVAAFALVVVWFRRRGFDITDEGLYVAALESPGETNFGSEYHRLLDLVLGPWTPSLGALRILSVVTLIGSGAALGVAAQRLLARRAPGLTARPSAATAAGLGALFGLTPFVWVPASFSYNTLVATAAALAVAAALAALVADGPRNALGWAAASGVAAAVGLVTKWPSGVSVMLIVVGLFVLLGPAGTRLRAAGGAVAGFVATLVVLAPTAVSPRRAVSGTLGAGNTEHRPADVLRDYVGDVDLEVRRLIGHRPLLVVGWTVAAVGLLLATSSDAGRRRLSLPAVAGGGLVALAATARTDLRDLGREVAPVSTVLVVLIVVASAVVIIGRRSSGPTASHVEGSDLRVAAVLAVAGLALPFAVAGGSTNELVRQTLTGGAGYGVVTLVALTVIASRTAGPATTTATMATGTVFALALALTVGFQAWRGTYDQPYGLHGSLGDQTERVEGIEALDGIGVEPEVVPVLTAARDAGIAAGVGPGVRILDFTQTPGLVVAAGGAHAGDAWLETDEGFCDAIDRYRDDLDEVGLVIVVEPVDPIIDECLTATWSAWPERVRPVGGAVYPSAILDTDLPYRFLAVERPG